MQNLRKQSLNAILLWTCLGLSGNWFGSVPLIAQTLPAVDQPSAEPQSTQPAESADQRFDLATKKLRDAMQQARLTGMRFFHSPAAESEDWNNQWEAATSQGAEAAAELKTAAIDLLNQSDSVSPDVLKIAAMAQAELYEEKKYERAFLLADRLLQLQPDHQAMGLARARAAILTNRFDVAREFADRSPADIAGLPRLEIELFRELNLLQENFQRELELRAAEAKADDLPRVELETTKGKIVIELFEDQVPETVANFVYLVENRFYDGMLFHRVQREFLMQSVAQAGLIAPNGIITPGYKILDELGVPNERQHFRGVISMANREGQKDSGGGEFFLTMVPIAYLNGHHPVFGRVISDANVLDELQATLTINDKGEEEPILEVVPDQIISAKVLRKRDHEYEPNRAENKKN